MAFYTVTLILLLALAIVLGLQWRLQKRIVNLQLETHKMMFPSQIRSARRTYVRGLQRQQRGVRAWRVVAIVLAILAGLAVVMGLTIHYQAALSANFGIFTELVTLVILSVQNVFLVPGLIFALIASALGYYLAHWRYRTLAAKDQDQHGGPQDLYWTPPTLLKQEYRLNQGLYVVLAVLSAFLLVSSVANWIPAGNSTAQIQSTSNSTPASSRAASSRASATSSSDASTSASSASASTSTSSPASAASSSSWEQQGPDGQPYPIDLMKTAKLAPASALSGLTEADHAALLFLEYWTLNGMDTSTIASYASSKSPVFAYHTVTGSAGTLLVFTQTIDINGKKQQTYMFYGWLHGEMAYLYNMFQSTKAIAALGKQYNISGTGSAATPQNPNIQFSDMNLRQLVGAFASYHDYQTVKAKLSHGSAIPLQ